MEAKKQKMDVVRLPESVEAVIKRILAEKQPPPPPLKYYARNMLLGIGEQASLEILNFILSTASPIISFSGFVSKLVQNKYPTQSAAVLSPYKSPKASPVGPSSASPNTARNGESLHSSSNLQRTRFQNISCQLSFEDDAPVSKNSASSLSREHKKMSDSITISPQLLILSKLEFRKLFLLLSYAKRKNLEAVFSIDDANEVYRMNGLPMTDFESNIWNRYSNNFSERPDRIQYLDWDSGKTHIYYCYVDRDGRYFFKGPHLSNSRTHLQRSLGDDNVLTVRFLEEEAYLAGKVVEEGLIVGLRRYRFFVFKDEPRKGKKKKVDMDKGSTYSAVKSYFVHFDSVSPHCQEEHVLLRKSVSEARQLFMHIHTLTTIEKYMARFSLILSKTTKIDLDFAAIVVEIIEDIPFQDSVFTFLVTYLKDKDGSVIHDEDGKPILHTDGTGYISEDLAMKCLKDLQASKHKMDTSSELLLIQCRLFHDGYAVKGTLLVNRKLEPGRIQVRPSMIKVKKDHTLENQESINSLEIVNTSQRPRQSNLSKTLIALLSYGGVPQEFFLNLLINALEETRHVYTNWRVALRVASLHDDMDCGLVAQRMICSGVPLDEPYLQLCLSTLESGERKKLKEGRIPVSESCYLMGTADPTGVLNNDEVCVILDRGQISGKVLVYRNPGIHFGDIHVMEAVYIKELEEFVGNAKYGIFFSAKGHRSAAYEMGTGDFDGDMYWVSRNPQLLNFFKANEPWRRMYPNPSDAKKEQQKCSDDPDMQLEHELFQLFLQARNPSASMGIAAETWLTYMDRMLTLGDDRAAEKNSLKTKMIKLIDIYYDALDAPKSGKKVVRCPSGHWGDPNVEVPDDLKAGMFPHHMGKKEEISYHSYSILGQIYDKVEAFQNDALLGREIWKLPCFDIEVPEDYIIMWNKRYTSYRKEMSMSIAANGKEEFKNDVANEIILKYKQLLYDAPDMDDTAKDTQVIYMEAVAIYHVTYNYARECAVQSARFGDDVGIKKCGFAWKVAGSALCSFCAWRSAGPTAKEKPLTILPSLLKDLLK